MFTGEKGFGKKDKVKGAKARWVAKLIKEALDPSNSR